MIGMHGGLPPSNTFPFTWFHAGLLPLADGADATAGAAAAALAADWTPNSTAQHADSMRIEDAHLVSTAQQYNMQAQVHAPISHRFVCQLWVMQTPVLPPHTERLLTGSGHQQQHYACAHLNLCAPTPSPSPPAQGYPPLVSWARDLVVSLHQPATLQKHAQTAHTAGDSDAQQQHLHSAQQQQQHEPVGMDVVITPGASAALDSLVRVLVNPGDPVLVEEFTYAHMAEAHLLPLG